MQSKQSLEEELWKLRNFDASKVKDMVGEIARTQSRAKDLLAILPEAEVQLWWVLGDLCDELRQLNVLMLVDTPEPLTAFLRAVPDKVCTWPRYPFPIGQCEGKMVPIPELDDSLCPISQDGFIRDEWQGIAFLPCCVRQEDLESVFGRGHTTIPTIRGTRHQFSAWMRQVLRVLEFSPWIGFDFSGEPGTFVTFWSESTRGTLDRIVATLADGRIEYGVVRVDKGVSTWSEGRGNSSTCWLPGTGWWGVWGEVS